MNPVFDLWLASCARSPGMLGGGVQRPDHTRVSRSFNDGFPPTHLEETLRCLTELAPVFFEHGLFPRWFTWTFEMGQLRVVGRPDGAMLVLAVQPNSAAAKNLDAFTEEFLALKLTG